jgi:hypothetical protein
MGSRRKIVAAVLVAAGAGGWFFMKRREHFEILIERDVAAYVNLDDCRLGRDTRTDIVRIPGGARLTVDEIDWGGKNWPCFRTQYQGRVAFLTSDQFKKL